MRVPGPPAGQASFPAWAVPSGWLGVTGRAGAVPAPEVRARVLPWTRALNPDGMMPGEKELLWCLETVRLQRQDR